MKKLTKTKKRTAEEFIIEKGDGVKAQIANQLTEEERSIIKALELKEKIDALNAELEPIKEYWKQKLSNSDTVEKFLTPFGGVERRTTNNYIISPDKISDLKKLFGDEFNAFVEEKITYGAKPALKELIFDADYKYSSIVRKAVTVKSSTSIVFLKPNKK